MMVVTSEVKRQKCQRIGQTESPSKVVLLGSDRQTMDIFSVSRRNSVLWCTRDMYGQIQIFDAWFELQSLEDVKSLALGEDYLSWLANSDGSIYMQRQYESIPNSIEYPLTEMVHEFGAYYLSPFSYMLALAIHSGFNEIEYCGPRISNTSGVAEPAARANIEYFLGVARGRGIRISVSPESILLRNTPDSHRNLKMVVRERLKNLRRSKKALRQRHGQLFLMRLQSRSTKIRSDRVLLGLQSLLRTDLRFIDGQIRECAHLLANANLFIGTRKMSLWNLRSLIRQLIDNVNAYLFGFFKKPF